ncbi:hypothetical protein Taro_049503 [Colocasia esculenta]|uniref:Uncharacterized protein n=1 Tax=Colocasia esculenta TaxID=4460 RepID=A0A843XB60_COLES|nr:hypothetical protein [Colocasia esculenta]
MRAKQRLGTGEKPEEDHKKDRSRSGIDIRKTRGIGASAAVNPPVAEGHAAANTHLNLGDGEEGQKEPECHHRTGGQPLHRRRHLLPRCCWQCCKTPGRFGF